MASYSVAEARDRLPALLVAAERGEAVTITRRGKPIVTLTPVDGPARIADPTAMTAVLERLAWVLFSEEDSVSQLEAMRSARDFDLSGCQCGGVGICHRRSFFAGTGFPLAGWSGHLDQRFLHG